MNNSQQFEEQNAFDMSITFKEAESNDKLIQEMNDQIDVPKNQKDINIKISIDDNKVKAKKTLKIHKIKKTKEKYEEKEITINKIISDKIIEGKKAKSNPKPREKNDLIKDESMSISYESISISSDDSKVKAKKTLKRPKSKQIKEKSEEMEITFDKVDGDKTVAGKKAKSNSKPREKNDLIEVENITISIDGNKVKAKKTLKTTKYKEIKGKSEEKEISIDKVYGDKTVEGQRAKSNPKPRKMHRLKKAVKDIIGKKKQNKANQLRLQYAKEQLIVGDEELMLYKKYKILSKDEILKIEESGFNKEIISLLHEMRLKVKEAKLNYGNKGLQSAIDKLENGCCGVGGYLPWNLKKDLQEIDANSLHKEQLDYLISKINVLEGDWYKKTIFIRSKKIDYNFWLNLMNQIKQYKANKDPFLHNLYEMIRNELIKIVLQNFEDMLNPKRFNPKNLIKLKNFEKLLHNKNIGGKDSYSVKSLFLAINYLLNTLKANPDSFIEKLFVEFVDDEIHKKQKLDFYLKGLEKYAGSPIKEQKLDWKFDHLTKEDKVKITNNGRQLEKIGKEEQFRVFGSSVWTQGTHRWTLNIQKWIGEIKFGICEESLFNAQKDKKSFKWPDDIKATGFYGIGTHPSFIFSMNKLTNYELTKGDRACFELDLDKGTFKIFKSSFNGTLLAKCSNLQGKQARPSITFLFPETIVHVSTFEKQEEQNPIEKFMNWQFGHEMKGSQVEISENGKTYKKIGDEGWFRIFGSRAWSSGIHAWTLKVLRGHNENKHIGFGFCEESLFNQQKDKTSFDGKDICNDRAYGINCHGGFLGMTKIVDHWEVYEGDTVYFKLNMDKGSFQIFKGSFNGTLLAETTSLKGKQVRPNFNMWYPDDKQVISLECLNCCEACGDDKVQDLTLIKNLRDDDMNNFASICSKKECNIKYQAEKADDSFFQQQSFQFLKCYKCLSQKPGEMKFRKVSQLTDFKTLKDLEKADKLKDGYIAVCPNTKCSEKIDYEKGKGEAQVDISETIPDDIYPNIGKKDVLGAFELIKNLHSFPYFKLQSDEEMKESIENEKKKHQDMRVDKRFTDDELNHQLDFKNGFITDELSSIDQQLDNFKHPFLNLLVEYSSKFQEKIQRGLDTKLKTQAAVISIIFSIVNFLVTYAFQKFGFVLGKEEG